MSTVESERLPTPAVSSRPVPLAWKPLSLVAAAVAIPLSLTLSSYGYDGDELYFIAAGRHLDWGYVDQPPLVPLIAWLMDSLFPGSIFALRLPSALVIVSGVFLVAQLAREMGGERRAQIITAATYALTFAAFGSLLQTDSFSTVLWLVIVQLVVRWVRLRKEGVTGRAADLPLLWAGIATAVALQVKFLTPVLLVALVIGVLVAGPRDMLRRPLLWIGAAIAVVTTLPGLVWQATNGWPQLRMAGMLRELDEEMFGGRTMFVPNMLLMTGCVVGVVLYCYGLWMLLHSPHLREYRFLGWTALGVIAIFLVAGGRFTYVAGIFPMVYAAAAVRMQLGQPRRWRWSVSWPMYVLSALLVLPTLPLLPRSTVEQVGAQVSAGEPISDDNPWAQLVLAGPNWPQQLAWPVLADSVAETYHALPPEVRQDTVIVTTEFLPAAALEVLGPARDLPEHVYSYSAGFGYLHTPPDATHYLILGKDDRLTKLFAEVEQVGKLKGNTGDLTDAPLLLATDPRKPLSQLWPELRYP